MTEVNNISEAVRIAKEFLEEVGFPFVIITKINEIDDKWYIEATAFGREISLKIDKKTGKISDYEVIQ